MISFFCILKIKNIYKKKLSKYWNILSFILHFPQCKAYFCAFPQTRTKTSLMASLCHHQGWFFPPDFSRPQKKTQNVKWTLIKNDKHTNGPIDILISHITTTMLCHYCNYPPFLCEQRVLSKPSDLLLSQNGLLQDHQHWSQHLKNTVRINDPERKQKLSF